MCYNSAHPLIRVGVVELGGVASHRRRVAQLGEVVVQVQSLPCAYYSKNINYVLIFGCV